MVVIFSGPYPRILCGGGCRWWRMVARLWGWRIIHQKHLCQRKISQGKSLKLKNTIIKNI